MEYVIDFNLASWHPFFAALPLALGLIMLPALAIWLARGAAFWRKCLLYLLGVNLLGIVLAMATGGTAENLTHAPGLPESLAATHETLALYALIGSAALLLVLGGLSFYFSRRITYERNPADPAAVRIVVGLLLVGLCALVFLTAYGGATMLWGVAVR